MGQIVDAPKPLLDSYSFADQYRLPLMASPPAWSDKVSPDAWKSADLFDGLSGAAYVDDRPAKAFVGATASALCLALVSDIHPSGSLLECEAVELWIRPSTVAGTATYRIVVSPTGQARCTRELLNCPPAPVALDGCKINAAQQGRQWHVQAVLPATVFGRPSATGEQWSINICRVLQKPAAQATLGNKADPANEPVLFAFTDQPCPAVHLRHDRAPATGDIRTRLFIHNPGNTPLDLQAELLLRRPKRPDAAQRAAFRLLPGQTHELFLKVEAVAAQYFAVFAAVADVGGTFLYTRHGKYHRLMLSQWQPLDVKLPPVDFRFGYYPYHNRVRIRADIRGLAADARLDRLTFRVQRKGGSELVKELALPASQFVLGLCDVQFDLPPLEGEYEIVAAADGVNVPSEPLVKAFQRKVFEWEHNTLGLSRKVFAPFTPIEVQGRKLRTVLKEYELNDCGLLDRIATEQFEGLDRQEILAAPMRYSGQVGGQQFTASSGVCKIESADEDRVVARSEFKVGPLTLQALSTLEYDGMLRVDLTLLPTGGTEVQTLDLEIPLRDQVAKMVHAATGRYRDAVEFKTLPPGQGVVWSAADLPPSGWEENFCNYLFLGNASRGLCWFTENDRGWSRPQGTSNLDVTRQGDELTLRVHLVSQPLAIDAPRTITFGLQAAPVKPRLPGWRHRWYTDNFSVLGCDCHWFALGNYGSFYPAGKDLSLWGALKQANKEPFTDPQIDEVIRTGVHNFERYGERFVRSFKNMARMNLQSRAGTQMVFYYNRDSYIGSEEFQTFMDEWGMEEFSDQYRNIDSPGCVGIIPSRSHMDFILHWYAKSFEVPGNTGVYMDNLFWRPFRNIMSTPGAYRRPDGSVVASNGIWELREQAKRTFTFMSELGIEPIHMSHMTSLEILPVLAFYTIQYDWEWQRGRGDVHDRFTREYLQLVSCGELSGNWPIVLHELGDQEENMFQRYEYPELRRLLEQQAGKAEDPWILKTFLGVTIVHEILVDPYRWHFEPIPKGDTAENRLFNTFRKPILDLVQKGDATVYRYWDERPQPATTGDADLPTIVFSRKGTEAIVAVTNYASQDRQATLSVDAIQLGFANGCRMIDVETGQEQPLTNGRASFELKKHDLKEFRLLPK